MISLLLCLYLFYNGCRRGTKYPTAKFKILFVTWDEKRIASGSGVRNLLLGRGNLTGDGWDVCKRRS